MINKPYITLFLLSSIDGKINLGEDLSKDFDKDIPNMKYASKGLKHYYDAEKTTDIWSINSGLVMSKMYNQKIIAKENIYSDAIDTSSIGINFIIYDNNHLDKDMILWLCKRAWPANCIIFSRNPNHDCFKIYNQMLLSSDSTSWMNYSNLKCFFYDDIAKTLPILRDFGCEKATLQTGETLNTVFLQEGFVDSLDLVVAPFIVGKDATNISGHLEIPSEFKLISVDNLGDSYIRVKYNKIK